MLLFHAIFAIGMYPLFLLLLNYMFGSMVKKDKWQKLAYLLLALIVLAIILTLALTFSETFSATAYILLTSALYILSGRLIVKKYPQQSIAHEKAVVFTWNTFLLPICNFIFLFWLGTQLFADSFVPNNLVLLFIIESSRWSLTSLMGLYYIYHTRYFRLFIAMGIVMAIPMAVYLSLHYIF